MCKVCETETGKKTGKVPVLEGAVIEDCICPECKSSLLRGMWIEFRIKNRGKRGALMISAEPENYEFKAPTMGVSMGDKPEFYCPHCNKLLNEPEGNIAKFAIKFKEYPGTYNAVISTICGQQATAVQTPSQKIVLLGPDKEALEKLISDARIWQFDMGRGHYVTIYNECSEVFSLSIYLICFFL